MNKRLTKIAATKLVATFHSRGLDAEMSKMGDRKWNVYTFIQFEGARVADGVWTYEVEVN